MKRSGPVSRRWLVVLVCLAAAWVAAPAVGQRAARSQDHELLKALRERLSAAVRHEEQLFEARIQLDLGLEVRESLFEPTVAEREAARFGGPERLDAERAAVARLARRHAELAEQAEALRTAAEERATREDLVLVQSEVPARSELEDLVARARAATAAQRAAQRAESTEGVESDDATAEDHQAGSGARTSRPAVFVQGAGDASALGFALLRAGNLLARDAERAARDGDGSRAEELKGAATKRFEDARASFESLREQDLATVRELFGLACTLERLGDLAAADSRYVQVMALDQETAPDGTVGYGAWGRAAQTARTVMHWLDDNRGWRPRRDPDEIPLPLR